MNLNQLKIKVSKINSIQKKCSPNLLNSEMIILNLSLIKKYTLIKKLRLNQNWIQITTRKKYHHLIYQVLKWKFQAQMFQECHIHQEKFKNRILMTEQLIHQENFSIMRKKIWQEKYRSFISKISPQILSWNKIKLNFCLRLFKKCLKQVKIK